MSNRESAQVRAQRHAAYDQLSALCAQLATALEKALDHHNDPDGVSTKMHKAMMADGIAALTACRTMSPDPQWQRVPEMVRELTALKEAVTPSAGTKAAYIGEFSFNHVVRDENGDEDYEPITVPWTTIKEIMAAIANRARGEG